MQLCCDDIARAATLLSQAGERVDLHGPTGLSVRLGHRAEAELNRLLVEAGLAVSHLVREQPALEQLFFDMTTEAEVAA